MGDAKVLLWAALPDGPRRIEPPAGATGIHDVVDAYPLGVYSALRTHEHARFVAFERHVARTARSLESLGLPGVDWDVLRVCVQRAADEAPFADSRLRFDVLGAAAEVEGGSTRCLVSLAAHEDVPEAYLREGVGVVLTRELAREQPRVKKAEFVLRRRPYPLSTRDRYEHVMVGDGERVLEGTSSNFAAVAEGALRFAGEGVLEGITLAILRELAREMGIPEDPRALRVSELADLDEAFISSSSRILVPVVSVDGRPVGDGYPGPLSLRLREAYFERARREARPAWPLTSPAT